MNSRRGILAEFLCLIIALQVFPQETTSQHSVAVGSQPPQAGTGEKTQPAAFPPPQASSAEKTRATSLLAAKEELLTELPSTFDKVGEASCVFRDAGPDHYAYAAKRGKKWLMVLDGKEGPEFVAVDSPQFSADGQHFAYRVVSQKAESAGGLFIRWKMVADGKEGREFEELSLPIFSPDSQHLAYRAKRTPGAEAREVLILDGKEVKESDYASQIKLETMTRGFDDEGQPIFSPDGRRWAYRARRKKNKELMLVDGTAGPEFEEVTDPVFSPDSQHFAYRAKLKKN